MTDQLDLLKTALADRYAIERELGSGGMATVYLAEDVKHHRHVAIKVLRPELAAALGPDRFLREIEIAAQLHHPHILPLYDSGRAVVPHLREAERGFGGEDFLYYVMPYVEGESLRDRLDREKQLPIDDALKIAQEVGDALSFAHSRGVIHRDIKPENILLESGHAMVADFGIARAVDVAGGERLTETGIALGTPLYMSPEQAAGSKDLDGRSDLYSLGCVLYEMLAGETPFTGPTVESIVQQHLTAEPPNVAAMRQAVPADVVGVLVRALAKAPADRFSPVGVFVEALARREVPSVATGRAAAKPRSRFRRAVLIVAGIVVGIVGADVVRRVVTSSGGAESGVPRLVVLPFENLGSPDDEYFADGMTDAITARIANIAGLQVISRASAVLYENTTKTPQQIGDELEVGYILEGTVQRERPGDPTSRVRIIPQLIDVSEDAHLWAGTFDEDATEVFRVQSDIAEQVASALEVTVLGIDEDARAARPTANQEAYDAYLRGMAHFRVGTHESQDSAIACLETAVEMDSEFALAHAALSRAYEEQSATFEGSETWTRRALASAERALALDSTLAEGYAARGDVLWSALFGFRHEEAARDLKRAIALNPNLTDAHDDLAGIYSHVGLLDEALEETLIAQSLDPLSVYAQFRRGLIALWGGDYPAALDALRPLPLFGVPYAAEALIGLGRTDEALEIVEAAEGEDPRGIDPQLSSLRAMVYAADGDSGATEKEIPTALAGRASFAHAHHIEYNVGIAYAFLGMHREAIEWLRQAATNGFPCLPAYERAEFQGSLRGTPEFRDLLDWLRAEEERLREVL